jgi:hypothetical protein
MMILAIRVVLLWLVISVNILGGALLFKRCFPRESPWLGFILPEMALIILLNFIEHVVPVPTLVWLLPLGTVGSLWLFVDSRTKWRGIYLPAAIFLGMFTFTLGVRAFHPDIVDSRDGCADIAVIANYLSGETVPPTESWFPPAKSAQYYAFMHYGGSVVIRLLKVDLGTGFNLCNALISAYTCFLAAAAAWRITRGSIWITVTMAILIECAGTGSSAILWLIDKNLDVSASTNPFIGWNPKSFVASILKPIGLYDQPVLTVPGSWSWMGSFHSTMGGEFLVVFSVWILMEVLQRKRTNFPWICAAGLPFLTLITLTWAVPVVAVPFIGGIIFCFWNRWRPQNPRFVVLGTGVALMCLMPTLFEFLTTTLTPGIMANGGNGRTQPALFLLQWWPVFVPWVLLCFIWHRLSPGVRCVHIASALVFLFVEFYNMSDRGDMTAKFWGCIYGAGFVAFFPAMAMRREWIFRGVTAVVILSSAISLGYWAQALWNISYAPDILNMEGTGPYRWDPGRARLLEAVGRMHGQTLLSGKAGFPFSDSLFLESLTGNMVYVAWGVQTRSGETFGEGDRRENEVRDFYDGKIDNPLQFLRSRNIGGVVIWPGDTISDAILTKLIKQLAPYYEYEDCRDGPDDYHMGLFTYSPYITGEIAREALGTPESVSTPAKK